MARLLEHKTRVRLPEPLEEAPPRARRSPALAVGVATWLAAVALAWGVQAGTIPVEQWLADGPAPERSGLAQERRRTAPAAPRAARPEPRWTSAAPAPAAPAVAPRQPVAAAPPHDVVVPSRAAQPVEPPPAPTPEDPRRPESPPPAVDAPDVRAATATGASCEAAIENYREQIAIGGASGPADLRASDFGAVLNRGEYFARCGVPDSVGIDICAAVRNGRAQGVTVRTTPRHAAVERCIARAVAGLAFPSHPRMDVARTHFDAAR